MALWVLGLFCRESEKYQNRRKIKLKPFPTSKKKLNKLWTRLIRKSYGSQDSSQNSVGPSGVEVINKDML